VPNPKLKTRIEGADLILLVGGRTGLLRRLAARHGASIRRFVSLESVSDSGDH
jgi:hypothetical protein